MLGILREMGEGMMKKSTFRGKRIDNGEWVEGYLSIPITSCVYDPMAVVIVIDEKDGIYEHEVYPATVGQTKEIYDRRGKPIYEGDILSLWWDGIHADGTPINTTYILKDILMFFDDTCGADIEVIGNIYEGEVGA